MRRLATTFGALLLMCVVYTQTAQGQAGSTWSMDEYQRLSTNMEIADNLAAAAIPASATWRSAMQTALETRRELVAYISTALRDGSLPAEFIVPASDARLILAQNIISISAELGFCEDAAAALVVLRNVDTSSTVSVSAYETAADDVYTCVPWSESAVADSSDADSALRRERVEMAGITLLVLGSSMLVSGVAWEIGSATGPRKEYRELSDDCNDVDCWEQLNNLSDTIDSSKAPIGILTIGGSIVGVTGGLMLLTRNSNGSPIELTMAPTFRSGFTGLSFQFR